MEGEQENFAQEEVQPESNIKKQFTTVTPLSKFLAMALFVLLPFLGFWFGYTLSPQKVVEVDKIVVKEIEKVPSTESNYVSVEAGLLEHKSFTFDLDEDKTDWILYENEEFGFSFQHPPLSKVEELTQEDFDSFGWGSKTDKDRIFSLKGDFGDLKFVPTIFVERNSKKIGILDQLNKIVYSYSSGIITTEIDGRPAFWACTIEGSWCRGHVVTENFIFRLDSITNITFDDNIVGSSEKNIVWPESIMVPQVSGD